MYKLILADDEKPILDGLCSFPWEDNGFTVIDAAKNGQDVISSMEKQQPDVIIADIKMPVLSGIEMTKLIRKENKEVEIILLTGYRDFEYAKAAVDCHVYRYLLKPLSISDLQSTLNELRNYLDEKKQQKTKLESISRFQKNMLNIGLESLFYKIIDGELTLQSEVEDYAAALGKNANQIYYIVLYFCSSNKQNIRDMILSNSSAIDELIDISFNNETYWIAVFSNKGLETEMTLKEWKNKYSISDSMLLFSSRLSDNPLQIPDLCKAISQSRNDYFFSNSSIFFSLPAKSNLANKENRLHSLEHNLLHAIENCDVSRASEYLKLYMNTVIQQIFPDHAAKIKHQIVFLITSLAGKSSLSQDMALLTTSEILNKLLKSNSVNMLYRNAFDILLRLINIYKSNDVCHSDPCSSIIDYIKANYSRKLTLDALSQKIDVTPSYFSTYFKKYTGKNFSEYIKDIRISKAKEFLMNTNMKIYEIAVEVGYDNYKYFISIFKKNTGETPLSFRTKHRKIN